MVRERSPEVYDLLIAQAIVPRATPFSKTTSLRSICFFSIFLKFTLTFQTFRNSTDMTSSNNSFDLETTTNSFDLEDDDSQWSGKKYIRK
jgi:hypothetical protein